MTSIDILRLYREFERYDRQNRDYAENTPEIARFTAYLSKLKSVCTVMQMLIETNDIEIIDCNNTPLNKYEVSTISKAVKFFINTEKRNAAAASA